LVAVLVAPMLGGVLVGGLRNAPKTWVQDWPQLDGRWLWSGAGGTEAAVSGGW